jgi:hypothetical protein
VKNKERLENPKYFEELHDFSFKNFSELQDTPPKTPETKTPPG